MTSPKVIETKVKGQDIDRVCNLLAPVLDKEDRIVTITACLTIALELMDPFAAPDIIEHGVREASEFICMYLSERRLLDIGTLPSRMIN